MYINNVITNLCITFTGVVLLISNSFSCTGLQLKTKDNTPVNGRTVEFGVPLQLSGLIVPRNYDFKGTLPDGSSNGMQYKSKYAAVGANTFNELAIVDGMNEKGLSAGAFYFPGYASYAELTLDNQAKALAPTEFLNWVLTQFSTTDEVKNALDSVVIVPTSYPSWGGVPPFHYVVYDKAGNSIVIEPLNGQLVMYDNPIGVITNSPTFDWQMTNLSNYINLSPMNVPKKTIDGQTFHQFGQGNGLRGMPGDFSPPSRFVRAAIFSTTAVLAPESEAAVFDVFHLLNQFDIPVGAVRSENDGKISYDKTIATTVKDPIGLKYYFRTYDDQSIRVIDLNAFNKDAKTLVNVPFKGGQQVQDISKTAKTI